MIALWMLYATAIGGLLGAAALAAEELAIVRRLPRRWGWLGAVLALLILPVATPARQPVAVAAPTETVDRVAPPVVPVMIPGTFAAATSEPKRPLPARREQLRLPDFALPDLARFDGVLLVGWAVITALLLAGYFGATLALAYQRRRWHDTQIDGNAVLIAPHLGPAVVGTLRQRIVLPAWSFALEPGMRTLILAHEREHLRARDPLILHFVTVIAYLLPWNLPLWWMLHRLRLAIELDCDTRVLDAGFDARRYANLLLAVGSRRGFAGRLVAPALRERKSFLFRRIVALSLCRPKFSWLRSAMATGAVCALTALAWFTPAPARAEQEGQPVPNDRRENVDTNRVTLRFYRERSDSAAGNADVRVTIVQPSRQALPVVTVNSERAHLNSFGTRTIARPNGRDHLTITRNTSSQVTLHGAIDTEFSTFDSGSAVRALLVQISTNDEPGRHASISTVPARAGRSQ